MTTPLDSLDQLVIIERYTRSVVAAGGIEIRPYDWY
jgi:hypothetical protein